jgi:hypothetical protein
MTTRDLFYVRGADGRMYLEIPTPEGAKYAEAEKGLAFKELPNGKWMAVRDMDLYARQQMAGSHKDFFDAKDAKHRMKRVDALEKQLQQMAIDRADPGISPNVKYVSDGEAERLLAEYAAAAREGRAKESQFQPMQAYAQKLITKSGKAIRPLLKGEIGMIGATIICLEAGYGTGNFSSGGL